MCSTLWLRLNLVLVLAQVASFAPRQEGENKTKREATMDKVDRLQFEG